MTDFTQPANPKAALKEHRPAKSRATPSAGSDLFAFPLSPAQEKMWLADRAQPGNPPTMPLFAGGSTARSIRTSSNELSMRLCVGTKFFELHSPATVETRFN